MPADATVVTLRKEVATALRDRGPWSMGFDVRETHTFKTDFEETDNPLLLVGIATWEQSKASRSTRWHDYQIDVAAMFRPKAAAGVDPAEKHDQMLVLMQEIGDWFWSNRLTVTDCFITSVSFAGPSTTQPYEPQHIENKNQFTSVLRLAFRKER